MMLANKVALVTGATRGIGRATAVRFAQEGAHLYLNGRNEGSLDLFCQELEATYPINARPLYFDVTDAEAVKQAFHYLFKQGKQLDILVNNAGVLDDALIGMVTQVQINNTFGVNTYSVLYTCQYASRLMARNKAGSIINMSSIMGSNGNTGQAVYAGSKAAVVGITKSLAKELAAYNIRVNAVAPGFIDTDMVRSISEEQFKQRLDSIKMKRIGTPEEVANTILFLASDLSSYVTGQVIGVDGGMLV